MQAERPLKVVFFQTESGNEPVREWLKSLPPEECKTIGHDILAVQYAWPVGKPLVDHLDSGVWEIRSRLKDRIARTLFSVVDQKIVLLHGFIKKQRKAPSDAIALAKTRRKLYLEKHEKEST